MAFYLLVPVFVRLIRGCTSAFFCYVLALILRYLWVKTGYGDYMMIFYYLHYFLLGMLVWEIHQAGRRIGAQLLVYIGMIAAAGAVLALGRAFGSAGKESAVGFRTLCCGRIGIRMRFIWCMP